jgi:methyl-accepting chemotaxis protein
MKLSLRQLSVKLKMFLFTAGTIMYLVLAGSLVYSLVDRMNRIHGTSMDIQALPVNILEMDKAVSDFHRFDLNTLTFRESGRSEGLNSFNETYHETYQKLRQLMSDPFILRLPLLGQKAELLLDYLSDADRGFQSVVSRSRNQLQLGISNTPPEIEEISNQLSRTLSILHQESLALNNLFSLEWERSGRQIRIAIAIILVCSICLFTFFIILIRQSILNPLEKQKAMLHELAEGRTPSVGTDPQGDEFARISGYLGTFIQSLKAKARFASDLAEDKEGGKLSALGEEDLLANSLIKLEKKMRAAKVEDIKYRQSRDERRWTNEGIAKFGELLRIHNNEISILAENIIRELVGYLDASAGGFYLISEGDATSIDLVASFAFERKKYLKKQYAPGEGLVGTCAIEKEKIILTEIPEDYINITSGLGEGKPRSLILMPLKYEEQILGIIEVASINRLKNYEIEFVENLADSIASEVSSVQMNMRTAQLLEQSQEQAREMAKQEEIMRQQMEELQTTQEESARRESEISGILNAIHNSSLVAEYNMNEELITINDKFVNLLESQRVNLIGKRHHELAGVSRYADAHIKFWEEIREGKTISKVEKITVPSGREIWLRQTFTPILDNEGELLKVLNIASDISETIEQQQSLEKQAVEITRANIEMRTFSDAVDSALIKCVYSPAGQILDVNENYENATGFTEKELVGKNNRIFLQRVEKEQFEKIWEDIQKNKPYRGVIRRTKPTGEEVWIMSTFTPVTDENGNIFKVFYLGQDITERKLKYQLLEEANKEIERLRKQSGEGK